jgi:hypothetical protein
LTRGGFAVSVRTLADTANAIAAFIFVKHIQKQWLGSMPWEKVLTVNQSLCEAQKTAHEPKHKSIDAARQLWEKSVPKAMSLAEVLEVCRRCQDIGPFVFNNRNTFAAISKTLVEDWARCLPSVEAQIMRTTVSHYVAGQIGKKELLQVLRHAEIRWQAAPEAVEERVAVSNPAMTEGK